MAWKGATLAALIGALMPQGAGAWEIGGAGALAPGPGPTIVGDYADSGLFGPAAARRPAVRARDPLVLDDDPAGCTPVEPQVRAFVRSAAEACGTRRRIFVDLDRPLDPSAVADLLGASALDRAEGAAGPGAIDPSTVLDHTPVYAPDIGATKWRTVLFTIEGMTRRGPKPLESSGPIRSHSDFIRALLQPLAVVVFLIIFCGTAMLTFKRQAPR